MDILQYIPIQEFTDPNKRIYWPYLVLCIVYALIFAVFSKVKMRSFGLNYWFHNSAKVDYIVWAFNYTLQIVVVPLIFINSLQLASLIYNWLLSTFGSAHTYNLNPAWGVVFYSLAFFILSDFTRFGLHMLMHKNRYLWNIHRMHHTAEILTPITFFRVHPFEMLLGHIRYLLVHAFVTGPFIYFYSDIFTFPTILGASFFVFLSNVLGGNLRHSHVPIGFGIFEYLFISPKQHQMHHSKQMELQQSNYGSFFAFWDMLFSSWKSSKGVKEIEYGLSEQPQQSFSDELVRPITKMFFLRQLGMMGKALFQKKNRAL